MRVILNQCICPTSSQWGNLIVKFIVIILTENEFYQLVWAKLPYILDSIHTVDKNYINLCFGRDFQDLAFLSSRKKEKKCIPITQSLTANG